MSVKNIVTAIVAGCAAIVIAAVPGLAGQASQEHQHPAAGQAKPASGMAAKDHAMMVEREKMMADMKAADLRLTDLVTRMNSTSGTNQVTATAAVVTEMVAQNRAMHAGMMKMQQGMMPHMMEHMQEGKDSMAMCPMMKQMGDMKH